ncbi:MAG: NUDIX domain-containing protein [Candidatus Diapherotrites archaeon]|uniref:NUDIX domain-containing protein n=1 Tax=Candidatus Iainarchaeum sp. TaxID=3101447 RepID=A0A938YVY0_9ARCH|nr:NUDIX domain-containing protein [Candidatus Diapherotrites archaeon]
MNKKLLDRAKQKLRVTDSSGNETGKTVERAKAHACPGVKHLAFLVFVVNGSNEFVLHKRIAKKVGSNLLDSPVSHVLANETLVQAVHRCLKHEYGISEKLEIKKLGGFSYEKDYGDGTCENEYCLVLSVNYSGGIKPNPEEMEGAVMLMPVPEAVSDSKNCPEKFEVWFNLAIPIFEKSGLAKSVS